MTDGPMSDPTSDPLLVPCEGSNCPGHELAAPLTTFFAMCSMCGQVAPTTDGRMDPHDRQDVLAMIDRGDFQEAP